MEVIHENHSDRMMTEDSLGDFFKDAKPPSDGVVNVLAKVDQYTVEKGAGFESNDKVPIANPEKQTIHAEETVIDHANNLNHTNSGPNVQSDIKENTNKDVLVNTIKTLPQHVLVGEDLNDRKHHLDSSNDKLQHMVPTNDSNGQESSVDSLPNKSDLSRDGNKNENIQHTSNMSNKINTDQQQYNDVTVTDSKLNEGQINTPNDVKQSNENKAQTMVTSEIQSKQTPVGDTDDTNKSENTYGTLNGVIHMDVNQDRSNIEADAKSRGDEIITATKERVANIEVEKEDSQAKPNEILVKTKEDCGSNNNRKNEPTDEHFEKVKTEEADVSFNKTYDSIVEDVTHDINSESCERFEKENVLCKPIQRTTIGQRDGATSTEDQGPSDIATTEDAAYNKKQDEETATRIGEQQGPDVINNVGNIYLNTKYKPDTEVAPPLISLNSGVKDDDRLAICNIREHLVKETEQTTDTDQHVHSEMEEGARYENDNNKQTESTRTPIKEYVYNKTAEFYTKDNSNENIRKQRKSEQTLNKDISENKSGIDIETEFQKVTTAQIDGVKNDFITGKESPTGCQDSSDMNEHSKLSKADDENISDNKADVNIKTVHYQDTKEISKHNMEHSLFYTGRLPTLDPCDEPLPRKQKTPDEQTRNHNFQENKKVKEADETQSSPISDSRQPDDSWAITNPDIKNDEETMAKSASTSVQDIKNLIKEINAPSQMYQLSKEKSLTPNDNVQIAPIKPISKEQKNLNEPYDSEQEPLDKNKDFEKLSHLDIADKSLTIKDVNQVTSNVMEEDFERQSVAKYDDLPHMKKILEYTDEMKGHKTEERKTREHITPTTTGLKITRTITDLTEKNNDDDSSEHRDDALSPGYEIEQTAKANQQDPRADKTSHSETDLREIIATAKQAIGDSETMREDRSGFNTTTITSSSGAWKTDTSQCTQNDGLICSRCLSIDTEFATSGFCHDCQEYLCGKCKNIHKKSAATMYHYVMESYCSNELKVRKYVRATGYCKECGIFLCGKCTINHTGFRAFRRHKIIQSSFISRQTRSKASTVSTTSLNTSYDKHDDNQYTPDKNEKIQQKKRKRHLEKLKHKNLYGMNTQSVSESLYPGPDRKLAVSYTNKPHWPLTSIPALPYLVKPGNMNERALKTPYLQAYKTPFYTQSKRAFDPQAVKMKAIQSRYNGQPARRTVTMRRRESGLYTARPLRNPDGVVLPDLASVRSYNTEGKNSHGANSSQAGIKAVQPANKLKTAEYLRDECLSIPFPSNEPPCTIGKMEILLDGRLVVLDKRNNNIKLFSKQFTFKAVLNFQNRLVDICSSNTYPTDVYVATPKHIHEISAVKGMEVSRKMKVEIERIEGIVCWKYGVGVIFMKDTLSWELRLLDYRGNLKSKLEILNPSTCEIEKSRFYHMAPSRGGKYVTLSDKKNMCAICVDVTTRCVISETLMFDSKQPSYLTADHQNNVFVACGDEIQQISAKGRNLGMVIKLEGDDHGRVGSIVYNTNNERLYVQIKPDIIAVYKMKV